MIIDPQFLNNAIVLREAGYDIDYLPLNSFIDNNDTKWLLNNKDYFDNMLCSWTTDGQISKITKENLEIELLFVTDEIKNYKQTGGSGYMNAESFIRFNESRIKLAKSILKDY